MAPPLIVTLLLLIPLTGSAEDCPQQKLFSFHKIKEKKPLVNLNKSEDHGEVSIQVPLDMFEYKSNLSELIQELQLASRISIRKRLFRYTTRVRGLRKSNLKITYLVNGNNTLYSVDDPSSRIGVSVTTRDLKFFYKKKHTRVDAYVDLLLDYSLATTAGKYTGLLEVTVECSQ